MKETNKTKLTFKQRVTGVFVLLVIISLLVLVIIKAYWLVKLLAP